MAHTHTLPSVDFEKLPYVGVVSALYDNPENIRYGIALRTAEVYQAKDTPLVVVDASPEPWVAESFQERGATVLPAPRPGLATQYMDGVDFALQNGADRVVRHEPEKVGMIQFADQILNGLDLHDILVIGRTERAMKTLPKTQEQTERLAGWLLQEHLNFPADALSGGRAYTREGAQYLLDYDLAAHGNNWLHLYHPVLEARKDGLSVGGIQIDLEHPPEMVAEEEGADKAVWDKKRSDQFFLQMENLLKDSGYSSGR